MKVIAKFRTVEVTYPDGAIVSVKCKCIKDALEYSKRFISVIPYRERAVKDKTYLEDFYAYLKVKGYIEVDLFQSKARLNKKAEIYNKLSQTWY